MCNECIKNACGNRPWQLVRDLSGLVRIGVPDGDRGTRRDRPRLHSHHLGLGEVGHLSRRQLLHEKRETNWSDRKVNKKHHFFIRRHVDVKVERYLLLMFSPPKKILDHLRKNAVFFQIQPSKKHTIVSCDVGLMTIKYLTKVLLHCKISTSRAYSLKGFQFGCFLPNKWFHFTTLVIRDLNWSSKQNKK